MKRRMSDLPTRAVLEMSDRLKRAEGLLREIQRGNYGFHTYDDVDDYFGEEGRWTDSETLMKERDEARAALKNLTFLESEVVRTHRARVAELEAEVGEARLDADHWRGSWRGAMEAEERLRARIAELESRLGRECLSIYHTAPRNGFNRCELDGMHEGPHRWNGRRWTEEDGEREQREEGKP